jgi:tRNA-dihydrouridine synthase C
VISNDEHGPARFDRAWAERDRVARAPDDDGLFVCLAPMDGVTDHVYRAVLTSLFGGRSGISLCVSEFVRVTDQPVTPAVFRRHCPELDTNGTTASGVPVFVQLLGGKPGPMAENAARAAELGAPGIDLNFGCPAKTVNRHDGGASLLKEPHRVHDVTAAVRAAVPASIPVTVKIRVGWDSSDPLEQLGLAAESAGAEWLTVHARTRAQLYKPPVHWEDLRRVVSALSIPVVANGDIVDAASLRACAHASDCHAFMIGRGAMGRPDAFAEIRGWRTRPLTPNALGSLIAAYAASVVQARGNERAGLVRIKQWLRMGAAIRPELEQWFERVKRLQSLPEALDILVPSEAERHAISCTIRRHGGPPPVGRVARDRPRA